MPLIGLFSLGLVSVLTPSRFAPQPAQDAGQEQEAAAELEQALEYAQKGRYDRAVAAYERIAERYPQTQAGALAARRAEPNALLGWADIERSGPSSNRVDVVVMGDGYTLKQQSELDGIAGDVPRVFERSRVFGEYFSYFNFIRAIVRSEESGSDGWGREVSTALDGRVLERTNAGNVMVSHDRVREVLRQMPEQDDLAIVAVQRAVAGVGFPGLAIIGGTDFRLLLHEWGHAFANLGDEYSIDNGIDSSFFREAPNVTSSEDPDKAPWRHWIEAKAPGIGVYRGGLGRLNGVWHPQATGCIMELGERFYCAVCREAIVLAIYEYVDPIEAVTLKDDPEAELEAVLRPTEPITFEVAVMRPDSHNLEAKWWVLSEAQAPEPAKRSSGPRSSRGPLVPITAEPKSESRGNKKGEHEFTLRPKELSPGRYRVICRVRDTTELRGEKLPWVLSDPAGLLESERSFLIEIAAD